MLAEWHAGRGLPTKLAPQTPLAVEVEHLQIEVSKVQVYHKKKCSFMDECWADEVGFFGSRQQGNRQ
jgi:hypothetical protein